MSTQWACDGEHVATTRWGGTSRGLQVDLELTEKQWATVDFLVSERGDRCTREELEARGKVNFWNRFRARARRRDLERLACRWSHEPTLAHRLTTAAQAVES